VEGLRQKSLQAIARNYLKETARLGFTPDQAQNALAAVLLNGDDDDNGEN
jgi:hypothetical protein